jgi:hypothetical protein
VRPDLGLDDVPKARVARDRYTMEVDTDDAFEVGFDLLDAYFGPRREMESRETLVGWRAAGFRQTPRAGVVARYHVALLRDADGSVAGARDTLIALDLAHRRAVALLSHARVLDGHRGTGAAHLLRAVVTSLAQADARELGTEADVVLVSEMEALDPGDHDSVRRLTAYDRAGFRRVDPARLPYLQPDFRTPRHLPWQAVPLQFCVRPAAPTWTAARVRDVWGLLHAIHGVYVAPEQLADLQARSIDRLGERDVDLLPLVGPT